MIIEAMVNPLLLIPAFIMAKLFYVMRVIFINTGRSFKRIEALSEFSYIPNIILPSSRRKKIKIRFV